MTSSQPSTSLKHHHLSDSTLQASPALLLAQEQARVLELAPASSLAREPSLVLELVRALGLELLLLQVVHEWWQVQTEMFIASVGPQCWIPEPWLMR